MVAGSCASFALYSLSMLKQFALLITIEPLMFLYTAYNEVHQIMNSNGIFQKLCRQRLGQFPGINCADTRSIPRNVVPRIQSETTSWITMSTIAVVAVIFVVSPIYGSFSDKHGRKTVILISLFGLIMMAYIYLLAISLVDFELVWLVVAYACLATCGGLGVFQSATSAYLADHEPDTGRLTVRYTIVQALCNIAEIIIDFALVAAFDRLSLQRVAILPIAFNTAAFLYTVIFLVEMPPRLCRKEMRKAEATVKGISSQQMKSVDTVETLMAPDGAKDHVMAASDSHVTSANGHHVISAKGNLNLSDNVARGTSQHLKSVDTAETILAPDDGNDYVTNTDGGHVTFANDSVDPADSVNEVAESNVQNATNELIAREAETGDSPATEQIRNGSTAISGGHDPAPTLGEAEIAPQPGLETPPKPKNEPLPPTSTPTVEAARPRPNPAVILHLLREAIWAIRRPRQGHFRAYILVTIGICVIVSFAGFGGGIVIRTYVLGHPLFWSPSEQSTFFGAQAAIRLVGCLITGVGLKKILRFHETTLLLIAIASQFGYFLLVGIAQSSGLMFAAAAVGFATTMLQVAGRSLLTQFIEVDETGKVFAIFVIVIAVSVLIGIGGLSAMFTATVEIYPGFVFLFVAGLIAVAFCAALWLHVDYWRYRKAQEAANKLKEPEFIHL